MAKRLAIFVLLSCSLNLRLSFFVLCCCLKYKRNAPLARYSGRHFERVSVPAHVRDKYRILMADREFAVVSGHTRRLFPRVCFHFWPQRRHHTCILFLSCKLPRNRSRQNSREPKRQTSVSSLLLEYDLKSRENQVANLKLSLFFSVQGDKSTASTLREGPFCSLQNILHVITHEGNFMRANEVCVWLTAVICVGNGFFLIITWPSGVSLYKCYSHHTQ